MPGRGLGPSWPVAPLPGVRYPAAANPMPAAGGGRARPEDPDSQHGLDRGLVDRSALILAVRHVASRLVGLLAARGLLTTTSDVGGDGFR